MYNMLSDTFLFSSSLEVPENHEVGGKSINDKGFLYQLDAVDQQISLQVSCSIEDGDPEGS